jgi:uncharacterized protein YxjI
MEAIKELHSAFRHSEYVFRRKVFKLFGGAFYIYDENNNLVFFSEQKPFRLKEDFRVYSSQGQKKEFLTIKTPEILDIAATYNVHDATTGETVGAVRRSIKSIFYRDEWIFLSSEGQEIGKLTESSMAGAFFSRWCKLIPQNYVVLSTTGREIAQVSQRFNPFVLKYSMRIIEPEPSIDRRLLIAAGILLAGIEGRQR